MPYIVIYYAEKRINEIPEYQVSIADVDLYLLAGSYTIKNIVLNKVNNKVPVPFFSAEKVNLAVEWSALIHGAFVAKMHVYRPNLNFVIEPNGANEQLSIDKEWEQAVKALFPLNFNQVILEDGKISLRSFKAKPPFQLSLADIHFEIKNLQNVTNNSELFSTFSGKGLMNEGAFSVEGAVDPFAKQPTFLLKSTLNAMQIQQANNLLIHFTHFDVKKGSFSLYSEIAAAKGKIHGYAKPIIKNLKVLDPQEKVNPVEFLYKGMVEIGTKIITNPKKHTIATKIKIEGDIENPETHILSIIGYVLRNAFIQALLPQIDHTVEMSDLILDKNSFSKSKNNVN